jgi:hypothetical protein
VASCPICDRVEREDHPFCTCGYNFANHDPRPAIRHLRSNSRVANIMWFVGTLMIFLAPAVFFATILNMLTLLVAVALAGGGVVLVTLGLMKGDAAKRQLAKARELPALPEARIIK